MLKIKKAKFCTKIKKITIITYRSFKSVVFSFQIVNREKRRFLERTGRFYAFTFGISQKSAVLIY